MAAILLIVILALSLNRDLFLFLHFWLRQIRQDGVWEVLTFFGDAGVTPLIMIWFIARRPDLVWATLWASLLAYMISHGLKPLVNELRPPAVLDHLDVLGPYLKYSSFPSGHATTIFTCVGLLTLGLPTRGVSTILLWIIGIAVALSRIAVGVHWPIDVLAGLIIGWLSASCGLWLVSRYKSDYRRYYGIPLTVLLLLVLFNLFGEPYGFKNLWYLQKAIALITAFMWFKFTRDWYRSRNV
ncbi:phosphatase PAP2 family protein [Ferrovum sp. PN-J185]|uniref:phosphatase PAP2 family protein n=1 Tax=Ferrovum sp. PN-J185 TaxID=1356306 RepID=UPI0018D285F8|nr:phosphatase PAP2 family protein [Ferrovum sp. PN-J185]MCC6068142.1 phosphatase PAP2 family protein [Ferrovum sp. PN-J185]